MTGFCNCKQDGYCSRYQRNMSGRFREICQGINCDLGTAAAFREQWKQETLNVSSTPDQTIIPLLLKTNQAPGDTVCMTAAIYSLHKAYPGKYLTAVESYYPDVFDYNPDVVRVAKIPNAHELNMHYPAIHQSNQRGIHFMQGWTEFLGKALGIEVPLLTNRPHLYFADNEQCLPQEDYWLICSGGKNDFTNKLWGHDNYQQVVKLLDDKVKFIQVGKVVDDHPLLNGIEEDMTGCTSLRQLFDLVKGCRGVVCGVSLLMHVAAALGKPAVVIAGGREPVQWNSYPRQHYLHTVGSLSCSDSKRNVGGACWRSRVMPLGDSTILDTDTCEYPVNGLPKCMRLITPEYVVETIKQIEGANNGI